MDKIKLYLIRHGETDWNLQKKAQGQTDVPLNKTGIHQAEELRDKLSSHDFNVCYCSPLTRARETAEIITGGRIKIIFDDNLKERGFGTLEGTNPETWHIPDDYDRKINTDIYGIEPIKTVLARSKKVLDRIISENSSGSNVLIVGHGSLLKALHFNIVGYNDDTDFHAFHFKNGAVAEYEIRAIV